jgi:hypothetical protein
MDGQWVLKKLERYLIFHIPRVHTLFRKCGKEWNRGNYAKCG